VDELLPKVLVGKENLKVVNMLVWFPEETSGQKIRLQAQDVLFHNKQN
jgi:hypothetical protein